MENVNPATLAALGKLIADAVKEGRNDLAVGDYKVDEIVTLVLKATVRVGEDYPQKIVGKAHPWALLLAVIQEANKSTMTLAKLAGKDPAEYKIDLAGAVKMAEMVDAEMVKEAQEEANKIVAKLKEPTVTNCRGKVTCKGSVKKSDPEAA